MWVAYDAQRSAGWHRLGHDRPHYRTSDDPRALYRTQVDAGTTILGDAGDSNRMYTVFYGQRS